MTLCRPFAPPLPARSPEDAQARYKQYKVEFHGGEIKAEFIEKKNDDA